MNHKAAGPRATARRRLTGGAPRTRAALAAAALLAICAAPFAGAATGDVLREGVRNGTTTSETQIISNLATTNQPTGGYSMRMSNKSSTGGGFINGCRASAAATSKPCYRANNLSNGRAFEFNSNDGAIVGTISVGTGGDDKKPLTTNATGVATGLNADRLDSLHASEIIAAARTKTGLDADTLDGQDAAAIIAAARTKTGLDADTLDGHNSTEFVQSAEVDRLIPVAVLNIGSDGTLRASSRHRAPITATPVVSHVPGSGIYDVDFPGMTFFFSADAANCTVSGSASRTVAASSIGGNDLRIFVHTDAGVATDAALYCSVYNLTD